MTEFHISEVAREEFACSARAVLDGRIAGVICKSYISKIACVDLFERFNRHPDVRTRLGDAYGRYLGTFHWRKAKAEYLQECRTVGHTIAEFSQEWRAIIGSLNSELLTQGRKLRNAVWDGDEVASPIARSWDGVRSGFALIPHEDRSQCTDPLQKGFEIQSVARRGSVCSLNLCIENPGGGELWIWNHVPSAAERDRYHTTTEGGPYPVELVENAKVIVIPIDPGDLYVFNGQYVHAVAASKSARATISCLLGNVSDSEAIVWT